MKNKLIVQFNEVIKDRQLTGVLVGIVLISLALVVYVISGLHYRDTPVVTRYTSYGTQHLYDSNWFEMLSFVGFGLLVLVGHVIITIKLRNSKNRNTAFVFGFATLMIVTIGFIIAHQVLRVAAL